MTPNQLIVEIYRFMIEYSLFDKSGMFGVILNIVGAYGASCDVTSSCLPS